MSHFVGKFKKMKEHFEQVYGSSDPQVQTKLGKVVAHRCIEQPGKCKNPLQGQYVLASEHDLAVKELEQRAEASETALAQLESEWATWNEGYEATERENASLRARVAELEGELAAAKTDKALLEVSNGSLRSMVDAPLPKSEFERIVTAPSDADLEALTDAVLIVETPSAMDVARNVLKVIADRARAPEREGRREVSDLDLDPNHDPLTCDSLGESEGTHA
jgi:predicted nuclease with TOPRIM domain